MVLLRESKKEEEINHTINDPVILVEGTADVGKTTLATKKKNSVTGFQAKEPCIFYQVMICYMLNVSNKSIKSFKELLGSLMPEVARSFQDDRVFKCGSRSEDYFNNG